MLKPGCNAYQEQDEYVCNRCGYRWDVKDPDPPRCKTDLKLYGGRQCGKTRYTQETQDLINKRGMNELKKVMSHG